MRYWYDSDNLSWTSNDGYQIWLDSNINAYKLYNHNDFCIRVWLCEDLRKEIEDLDIKLYEYVFYKAERFITLMNDYYYLDQLPDPECTVKIKIKDNARTCGNCNHLIFKDYKERTGSCRLTRLYRRFSDCCLHEEEMS